MIIHRSGSNGIALYIDAGEMAACGFEALCEEDAKTLAEVAINDLGITASLSEVAAFAGNGGAMIFASLRVPPKMSIFRFSGLNDLLDAAGAVGDLVPERSSLFLLDGAYFILALDAADAFPLLMSEYAVRVPDPDVFEPFLREHGKLLAFENALVRLTGAR